MPDKSKTDAGVVGLPEPIAPLTQNQIVQPNVAASTSGKARSADRSCTEPDLLISFEPSSPSDRSQAAKIDKFVSQAIDIKTQNASPQAVTFASAVAKPDAQISSDRDYSSSQNLPHATDDGFEDSPPPRHNETSTPELTLQLATGLHIDAQVTDSSCIVRRWTTPPDDPFRRTYSCLVTDQNLHPTLIANLDKQGITSFTTVQANTLQTLQEVARNTDILVKAPNRSGKTTAAMIGLCDLLLPSNLPTTGGQITSQDPSSVSIYGKTTSPPAPVGIVFAPTPELAEQLFDDIDALLASSAISPKLLSGRHCPLKNAAKAVSRYDVLVTTPGAFAIKMRNGSISLHRLKYLCFDEAELIFKPQNMPGSQMKTHLRQLKRALFGMHYHLGLQGRDVVRIFFCSATVGYPVQEVDITDFLRKSNTTNEFLLKVIESDLDPPSQYIYHIVTREPGSQLTMSGTVASYVSEHCLQKTIIFVNHGFEAVPLEQVLLSTDPHRRVSVMWGHDVHRYESYRSFSTSTMPEILICMQPSKSGINIKNLRHVVVAKPPETTDPFESVVRIAGLVGRSNYSGTLHIFEEASADRGQDIVPADIRATYSRLAVYLSTDAESRAGQRLTYAASSATIDATSKNTVPFRDTFHSKPDPVILPKEPAKHKNPWKGRNRPSTRTVTDRGHVEALPLHSQVEGAPPEESLPTKQPEVYGPPTPSTTFHVPQHLEYHAQQSHTRHALLPAQYCDTSSSTAQPPSYAYAQQAHVQYAPTSMQLRYAPIMMGEPAYAQQAHAQYAPTPMYFGHTPLPMLQSAPQAHARQASYQYAPTANDIGYVASPTFPRPLQPSYPQAAPVVGDSGFAPSSDMYGMADRTQDIRRITHQPDFQSQTQRAPTYQPEYSDTAAQHRRHMTSNDRADLFNACRNPSRAPPNADRWF